MSCVVCNGLGCEHCPHVERSVDRPDYAVRDEGTLLLLWAITPEARDWVEEHLPEDRTTWMSATVIEARYAPDILNGLAEDGLVGKAAA